MFVAVPGGKLGRGVSASELRALLAQFKPHGPEALAHVREAAAQASPAHVVTVAPFLCAETPLLGRHERALKAEGDAANPHDVLMMRAEAAAALTEKLGLRLLSEAEWEWLARGGSKGAWLSGKTEPAAWTRATLRQPLERQPHVFGVRGLGWGEWVDDGWHSSYRGAPKTSAAWEPKTRPEQVRGGGLAVWPWQGGGEALLLHAALRQKASAAQAVRWAVALPAR